MNPQLFLLGVACIAGSAGASVHGPFVQWWDSPETRASVRWVETGDGMAGWRTGKSGFGYGDGDDATVIREMEGKHRELSIRRSVEIPKDLPAGAELVLLARYDDAFELWIDGKKAVSENVRIVDGRMQVIRKHEAERWEEFVLPNPGAGRRIVAATGYNDGLQSSDFTLDLKLVARWDGGGRPLIEEGAEWQYLPGEAPTAEWRKTLEVEAVPEAGSPMKLAYRLDGEKSWRVAEASRTPLAKSPHRVASVELADLPPGQVIQLKLGERRVDFRSAPVSNDGLRFVTGGDMFHDRGWLDAMNARAGAEGPVFALLGGDLAYANNQNPDRWLEWIDSWVEKAVTPEGLQVPMVIVIGNHEVIGAGYRPEDAPGPAHADEFFSLFRTRESGKAYQVLDFKGGLSLVLLDSGHSAKVAEQTAWLEKVLAERAGSKRLFACYHRPAWGCGTKEDAVAIQRAWCPLFERYRVNAVFENDHHVHSRTKPITAGEVDEEDGIPYLGAGAWGVAPRSIPKDAFKKRPWLAAAFAKNHLYRVEIDAAGWKAEAKEADGTVFDKFGRHWRR